MYCWNKIIIVEFFYGNVTHHFCSHLQSTTYTIVKFVYNWVFPLFCWVFQKAREHLPYQIPILFVHALYLFSVGAPVL